MPTSFRSVEAVFFDAVGTLIYPDPPVAEVYRRAGDAFGVSLTTDEVRARFRAAFAEVFTPAARQPTSNDVERDKWRQVVAAVFRNTPTEHPCDTIFNDLWEHFARTESWSLYPDALAAWQELESRGLQIGIASNYDDRLLSVIAGLPPIDRCTHVFWSSRVGYAKPDRRFFDHIAHAMRLRPERLLLVGDDWQNDIIGATVAGWHAVYVDRDAQAPVAGSIRALTELASLLDCLSTRSATMEASLL